MPHKIKNVFVSYSHDTKEHKDKVRIIADKLITDYGIEVTGDFYNEDNPVGGQFPDLMEKIRECDRVICVLTPEYKTKADEGKGGVGYEKTIITDELFHDIGSNKFIPTVISEDLKLNECTPNFLTSTRMALLRSQYENNELFIEEIARVIHDTPKNPKPPLGRNKLLDQKMIIDAENVDIERIIGESNYKIIFETFKHYANTNDEINFRRLLNLVKKQVFNKLKLLREEHQKTILNQDISVLSGIMDQFVNVASPLFLIAFAGCLSFNEKFHNQEGLLIDLLTMQEWNEKGGLASIYHIPKLLAFVYHHVYGALNVDNNRISNLKNIFEQKIPSGQQLKYEYLYKVREVTGWIESLGRDCFKSFNYLLTAFHRWKWLDLLFENEDNYKRTLVCYQTTLNLLNYFTSLKSNLSFTENNVFSFCDIPPSSIIADRNLKEYTHHYLIKNSGFFKDYLTQLKIPPKQAIEQWELWQREISKFNTMGSIYTDFRMFEYSVMDDIFA